MLLNVSSRNLIRATFLVRMNFLSNILREEGGFDYKKAIVDSILILIREIPDAKESGLSHLSEFIEDCEFTYLSTQVCISYYHHF
jgi:coatomer protein complex subunit gamma